MADDTTPSGRIRSRTPDSAKVRIKGKWTAVPNRLLTDQRLSRDARLLGCLLFLHAGNSGKTFPSQEELAAELSFIAQIPITDEHGQTVKDATGKPRTEEVHRAITTRSIQRWLSELKAAGWLDWRQTMRNNEYTLLDPAESDTPTTASRAASLNTGLKGATALSYGAIEGSHGNATEGSSRATEVSRSNTTEGSTPNTTEGSPPTTAVSLPPIPLSHSSSYIDSLILDSSSVEQATDDDVLSSPTDRDRPAAACDHTALSRYLAARGVSTAAEFRDLPLALVERTWHDITSRDPSATPRCRRHCVARDRGGPPRPTAARRHRPGR